MTENLADILDWDDVKPVDVPNKQMSINFHKAFDTTFGHLDELYFAFSTDNEMYNPYCVLWIYESPGPERRIASNKGGSGFGTALTIPQYNRLSKLLIDGEKYYCKRMPFVDPMVKKYKVRLSTFIDNNDLNNINWHSFRLSGNVMNSGKGAASRKVRSAFRKYCTEVNRQTRILKRTIHFKNVIDPKNRLSLPGRKWHLDHIYSKKQGFLDEVSETMIGSLYNLQVISSTDNITKGKKCGLAFPYDMTLDDLYEGEAAFKEIK